MELSIRVVKGTLRLTTPVGAVRTPYGNPVPVVGVKVLVEATEIAVVARWDDWAEDRVNPAGHLAPIARAGGRA